MANQIWKKVDLYCVRCGNKLIGFQNKESKVKVRCDGCGINCVSQRKSRRHAQIDIYMSEGDPLTAENPPP